MNTPICDFVREYQAKHAVRLHMPGHKGKALLGPEPLDLTEIPGADVLYEKGSAGVIAESEANAAALFGTAKTLYSVEGSSLCIRAMLYLVKLWAARRQAAEAGHSRIRIAAGRNAHKTFVTAAALLDIDIIWMYGAGADNSQDDGRYGTYKGSCGRDHADSHFDGNTDGGDDRFRVRGKATAGIVSCVLTPAEIETVLLRESPDAVYLTSPDYLGNLADIRGIAEVCRRYGCPLLVDNAHGAYLKFLPDVYKQPKVADADRSSGMSPVRQNGGQQEQALVPQGGNSRIRQTERQSSMHPIDLGADLCCDSAHKTLPVLTGGAYLHIAKRADGFFLRQADLAMQMFASTSPSYLILQSLDLCNRLLADGFDGELRRTAARVAQFKHRLEAADFCLVGSEPLKITVDARACGHTGDELERLLREQNIVCEFSDPDYLVMMFSPCNGEADFALAEKALCGLSGRARSTHALPIEGVECAGDRIPASRFGRSGDCSARDPKQEEAAGQSDPDIEAGGAAMRPAEALLCESEEIDVGDAEGRVMADICVSCPPAVPIVVCGEVIDREAISRLQYYGVKTITVLIEKNRKGVQDVKKSDRPQGGTGG